MLLTMLHGYRMRTAATLLLVVCGIGNAFAVDPPVCATFTESTAQGWFTSRIVRGTGEPGDVVTVTFASGTTQHITVGSLGRWALFPNPGDTAGAATLSSTNCPPAVPIVVASLLNPPSNSAIARHTVLAGSTASVAGNSFALAGGYTLTATAVNYDPLSTGYGDLSGAILASDFSLIGTGPAGTFSLHLTVDQPYTVSMLSVFAATDPVGALLAFSVPISGTVTFGAIESAFDGLAVGTSTFGADGAEVKDFALALHSDFGDIAAQISSSGIARLISEPGGVGLVGLAALGFIIYLRRRSGQVRRAGFAQAC